MLGRKASSSKAAKVLYRLTRTVVPAFLACQRRYRNRRSGLKPPCCGSAHPCAFRISASMLDLSGKTKENSNHRGVNWPQPRLIEIKRPWLLSFQALKGEEEEML
jgi:hypothetical protein